MAMPARHIGTSS